MGYQLAFGKFLGLFIADVPDSYLRTLDTMLENDGRRDKKLDFAIKAEQLYRVTYKKWVEDNGTIHFGKGYEEVTK